MRRERRIPFASRDKVKKLLKSEEADIIKHFNSEPTTRVSQMFIVAKEEKETAFMFILEMRIKQLSVHVALLLLLKILSGDFPVHNIFRN